MFGKDDSICRMCLFSDPTSLCLVRIFSNGSDSSPIANKIYFALHLKVSNDEGLPKYVCNICVQKFEFIATIKLWFSTLQKQYAEIHTLLESYRSHGDDTSNKILLLKCEERGSRNPDSNWLKHLLDQRESVTDWSLLSNDNIGNHFFDQLVDANMFVPISQNETSEEKEFVSLVYLGNTTEANGANNQILHTAEQGGLWATSSEQESISVEAQIPASYNPQNDMTDYISEENANTSENNVVFPTVKNGATGKKEFTSLQYLGNKNKDPHCSKTEEPAFDRAEISKSHNAGQGHIWSMTCEQEGVKPFEAESASLNPKSDLIDHSEVNVFINGNNSSDGDDYNETNSSKLYNHVASESSCDRQLRCPECEKFFDGQKLLVKHLMSHEGAAEKYQCAICKRKFVSTSELNRHLRAHRGLKPYKCEQCGQFFSQRNLLDKHINWHEGRKSHLCDICGQVLSSQQNLRMHMQHLHSLDTKKPFQCKECRKTFSRKHHLNSHSVIHENSRPHQCAMCGVTFKRSSQLKEHEQIHSGEKKHKCNECNRTFALKRVLNVHKLMHSGLKRHQCSVCSKSFIRRNGLVAHQKTHAE